MGSDPLVSVGSPVICLPVGSPLIPRLQKKLAEYHARKGESELEFEQRDPKFAHPDSLSFTREKWRDSIHKASVLGWLLSHPGQALKTWDLSIELEKKMGAEFSVQFFSNACAIMQGYLDEKIPLPE